MRILRKMGATGNKGMGRVGSLRILRKSRKIEAAGDEKAGMAGSLKVLRSSREWNRGE